MFDKHPFNSPGVGPQVGKTFPKGTPLEELFAALAAMKSPEPPEATYLREFTEKIHSLLPTHFKQHFAGLLIEAEDEYHFHHILVSAFIGAVQKRVGYASDLEKISAKGRTLVDAHYGQEFVDALKKMPDRYGYKLLFTANAAATQKDTLQAVVGLAHAVAYSMETPHLHPGEAAGYFLRLHRMSQKVGPAVIDAISTEPTSVIEYLAKQTANGEYIPRDYDGMSRAYQAGKQKIASIVW